MASSLYIEQAHLFAKVETLCDCWEGHDPLAMCEEWNGVSGKKEAWVPTLEKKEAYQIKVEHGGKITSFDKAHDTMKKWANGLCMIGVITTSVGGHGLHAVCIQYADDSAVVRACKPPTHGVRRNALYNIDSRNFKWALLVDGAGERQEWHECLCADPIQGRPEAADGRLATRRLPTISVSGSRIRLSRTV